MPIPAKVQAHAAVAHGEQWQGELPVKLMPRLAGLVADAGERIGVTLKATDEPGFPVLRGWLEGRLSLVCRRCGASFAWQLQAEPELRLVYSEDEEKRALPDSEPYLVEHDQLPLREIVEDEVLLALPMLARCETCENEVRAQPETSAPPPDEPRRDPSVDGPFAALKEKLRK